MYDTFCNVRFTSEQTQTEGEGSVNSKTWTGTQTCLIPKSQALSSEDDLHVRDRKEERRTVDGATAMGRYQDTISGSNSLSTIGI